MKKIIATILIISMVLSIGFNIFLFKPKKAKAFLGIGDIVIDVVSQVKEWIVDEIPRRVARHMMVRLQQEIARWAQGGFSDENKPFAMTSWSQEIKDALNIASGRFIEEFGLTPLCMPIRVSLGTMLGLNQFYRVPYTEYAACTMERAVGNVVDFWENPSIGMWGWDTWTALTQPQNNIYGSFFLALERKEEIESEEIEEKEMQKDIGEGYKPEQECLEYQEMSEEEMVTCKNEKCVDRCDDYVGSNYYTICMEDCWAECEQLQTGICLQYRTKNLGSTIHSAIESSIQSDIDWLISAEEITEMFDLVFSGLFNKLLYSTGLAGSPFYQPSDTISKEQLEYGYYEEYKKTQTPEDIKDLKRDILDNILKAIKRITTSTYECDKSYQIKGEVLSEVAAEILDEEAQHLYAATEGINLKPDFEVLDGPAAVERGIAVYGQTWDSIPFNKYPPKCSEIANTKCSSIFDENLRNNCYVCLKEYFIPASYCEQIYDYINRSFVKYPGQVYEDLWWGGFTQFDTCAQSRTSTEKIPLGLTCRIMPDFVFPGGATCKTACNVTEDELKDITDNEPNDSDCNPREWRAGAFHPGGQYIPYLVRKKAKCCAALTGHEPEMYKICRGITGNQPTGEPPIEEPSTACHTNEEFNTPNENEESGGFASTIMNIDRTGATLNDVLLDIESYGDCIILRSAEDVSSQRNATVYITKPYCDAYRDFGGNRLYWSDLDEDNNFSDSFVDIHQTHQGEFLGYCKDTNGSWKNPPASEIICEFDIDQASLDPITGKPYKICCGLSDYYDVQRPSQQDCINAGVPASACNANGQFYTGGIWMVVKPDSPTGLGGAELCICQQSGYGCGEKCSTAGCW